MLGRMYEITFGLSREPFSVAPDPRFLYLSRRHREALAHLSYGLRGGGGFVLLTGEIGAGKTTVWRTFLEQLPPGFDVAYVVNPRLPVPALLARVCEDLRVELAAGADAIDALHGHLLLTHAQERRTLIVVDEAQALSIEALEALRLLTNLVTGDRKLVQVLLIGQPELRQMLEQPELEPVAQRVVSRFHLPALSELETTGYITHRLTVAGLMGPLPFDDPALARIHELCGGIPRRINVLCDRALLGAHLAGTRTVTREFVDRAAQEVFGRRPDRASASPWPTRLAGAGLAAVLVAGLALIATPWWRAADEWPRAGAPVPAAATATAAPAVDRASAVVAPAPAAAEPAGPAPATTGSLAAVVAAAPPDEAAGWRALGLAWGVQLAEADPCGDAALRRLQCYRGRGGLGPVRQVDRPVMLRLPAPGGRTAHVVLSALGDGHARIEGGGIVADVPLPELARQWRGEFGTLWRQPEGSAVAGGTAPDPEWLGARLAAIDGAPPPGDDTALRRRVFAFQLAQGLPPDGIAGPLTMMRLNRSGGVDEPRLERLVR
jgi:general secretion pathway protein A